MTPGAEKNPNLETKWYNMLNLRSLVFTVFVFNRHKEMMWDEES